MDGWKMYVQHLEAMKEWARDASVKISCHNVADVEGLTVEMGRWAVVRVEASEMNINLLLKKMGFLDNTVEWGVVTDGSIKNGVLLDACELSGDVNEHTIDERIILFVLDH